MKRMEAGPVLESVDRGDELGVLSRMVSTSGSPRQEVTNYAAASLRPRSYPPELPFVPAVPVWVTVFADDEAPAGARWVCGKNDVERIRSELTTVSQAAGWQPSQPPPGWPEFPAGPFVR